ncbi:MAG: thiamine-phosphate kinase [Dehalococcoidales bacterium]
MKVSELGEFGLIELLSGMADRPAEEESAARRQLIIGIGDDAAAWQGDDSIQLATTDFLVQDVHFSLEMTSWQELGWRALAANLSDIAAMGGLPRYALVSLAMPGFTEVDDVAALYRGMLELAGQSGTVIIGGDMSAAPLLVISITVLGGTGSPFDRILTRSAARPGDKVAVTGTLGGSAAGLEMLTKRLNFSKEESIGLKQAFTMPSPRLAEGRALVELGVKAAIDVSDGLLSDLGHICRMSRVNARIETDSVPIHPAVIANFGDRGLELALGGGEDYELLFTAPAGVIAQVRAAVSCPVTVIGEITAGEGGEIILLDGRGNLLEPPRNGWEHFSPGQA